MFLLSPSLAKQQKTKTSICMYLYIIICPLLLIVLIFNCSGHAISLRHANTMHLLAADPVLSDPLACYWGKPIGIGQEGASSRWPPPQTKIILHMYFGLRGPLWTSFQPPNWFSGVKKCTRHGYTNVTCFSSAKTTRTHQITVLWFFVLLLFEYLFIPLSAVPYSRVPLLGYPMQDTQKWAQLETKGR